MFDLAERWDRSTGRGSTYYVTYDDDEVVNEYPQDDIPEPGGYNLIALMDDGDTLCEWCVRDPFNPVTDRRTDNRATWRGDGWGVVAWVTTGDTEGFTACAHCNRVLVEDTEEE
jgi:hypothetical protein